MHRLDAMIEAALDLPPPEELDLPFMELALEDQPDIDTILRTTPVVLSQPTTAAQTTNSERISIRVPHWVLLELKRRAAAEGTRYQTYLNLLLAQHAAHSER